jgi:hypothetical protein
LNAKILSVQTFTMFVVMALVTTCATAPITYFLYPPKYQIKIEAWRRGEIEWDSDESTVASLADKQRLVQFKKILINLRLDSMPAILTFMRLLSPPRSDDLQIHPAQTKSVTDNDSEPRKPDQAISVHGIRLITLSERPSSVMQVSEVDEFSAQDQLIRTFRSCGELFKIKSSGELDVVPETTFAETIVAKSREYNADLLLLPWGETGALSEVEERQSSGVADGEYASFLLETVQQSKTHSLAIFVPLEPELVGGEKDFRPGLSRTKSVASLWSVSGIKGFPRPARILGPTVRHIFCGLFGGPDDLAAMSLAIQAAEKGCTATIVRFAISAADTTAVSNSGMLDKDVMSSEIINPEVADREKRLFLAARATMDPETQSRIVFDLVTLPTATHDDASAACVERAKEDLDVLPKSAGGLVILGRNWGLRGLRATAGVGSGKTDSEKCLGPVGLAVVDAGLKGGLIVMRAAS